MCYKTLFNHITRRNHERQLNKRIIDKKQRVDTILMGMRAQGAAEEQLADVSCSKNIFQCHIDCFAAFFLDRGDDYASRKRNPREHRKNNEEAQHSGTGNRRHYFYVKNVFSLSLKCYCFFFLLPRLFKSLLSPNNPLFFTNPSVGIDKDFCIVPSVARSVRLKFGRWGQNFR